MRKHLIFLAFAAMAAAPTLAHANCHDRRVTGTVIGAVGGGLIGAGAAHGAGRAPWGFLGAGLGALAGNAIAGAGCGHYAYYHRPHYPRRYYGDRYYAPAAYAPRRCEIRYRTYYDAYDQLIEQPVRVCY